MKPLGLLAAIVVMGAAGAVFLLAPKAPEITVTDAVLSPMGGGHALTAKIENAGGPDRLIAVGSGEAERAMIAGTDRADLLAIPAGASPGLAIDGAHGMLTGLPKTMEEGRLVPVEFVFEAGGRVATRARVGGAAMQHGGVLEAGEGAPALSMTVTPDGDGWDVALDIELFEFSGDAVDGPHQPGVGHVHLYLNGLKLQRMYSPEARIGALPRGRHEVRVVLNTNDHRAYAVGGQAVEAVELIEVD